MRVLNIAGLAIIFAVVRSTTSTASGQRWANKPYETPGGYTRSPTMRPNVHAPRIHKRDVIPTPKRGINIGSLDLSHDRFSGFLVGLPPRHSLPESTETMTDDHPEHHHQPRPVITQKPGPISETPLMSSEADTEEHIMPPVMTEDDARMPGKEFTNAPESNEAMNEEMSGHNFRYVYVPEFKEALHELVQDAVENVVDKIIEKFLIRHDGEATGREPQQGCGPGIVAPIQLSSGFGGNRFGGTDVNQLFGVGR